MGRSIKDTIKRAKGTLYVTHASNMLSLAIRGINEIGKLKSKPLRAVRKAHLTSSVGQVSKALSDFMLKESNDWDFRITFYTKTPDDSYDCNIEVGNVTSVTLAELAESLHDEIVKVVNKDSNVIGWCWAATPYECPMFKEATCDDAMHEMFVNREGLLDEPVDPLANTRPSLRPARGGAIYERFE